MSNCQNRCRLRLKPFCRALVTVACLVAEDGRTAEPVRQEVERFLADPHRPKYHFVIDGEGSPGDPNGAFWHRGRYHLMYLYRRPQGFCWGHSSSADLLLFISHNRGCQYYVGTYDTAADRFLPESHGRMTWRDKTYFAPEALVDGKGRLIVWTWLLDNLKKSFANQGWTGVYGLPRTQAVVG